MPKHREKGTTLVIVTHDLDLAKKTDQIVQLKGGKLFQGEI
jgi:putative ABC transport system ATP-binding protein